MEVEELNKISSIICYSIMKSLGVNEIEIDKQYLTPKTPYNIKVIEDETNFKVKIILKDSDKE